MQLREKPALSSTQIGSNSALPEWGGAGGGVGRGIGVGGSFWGPAQEHAQHLPLASRLTNSRSLLAGREEGTFVISTSWRKLELTPMSDSLDQEILLTDSVPSEHRISMQSN